MNATVTFRESTLSQEGTVGKILRYVQDYPQFTKNTNIKLLSTMVSNHYRMSYNTVRANVCKMINNQMLLRQGGKRHGKIMVNYYHKDVPGYIMERAPQDIQDRVKAMKDKLEEDQYISQEGCLVTKGDKEPKTNLNEEAPEEEATEEPENKAEEQTENQPKNVVVPVEVKDDAKGLNLTITLNLTINK